VLVWDALTAAVEETMKRDEGLDRAEMVRTAERPRQGAGRWLIDERRAR